MTSDLTAASMARASQATIMSTHRERYVDVFRGLLIAHMALDHASLMLNGGRGGEELAAAAPDFPSDIWQFLTRFTGIPAAPAFCFMAGFMVALTSFARADRGVSHAEVTRRLIVRGLVLIAADAVILGLPRALMGFYSFMVLSSIGIGIIVVALVRNVSSKILVPIALAVLLLHPLLDVSGLPVALRAVLYEPVRDGAFRSLYPLVPWGAVVVLGFVVGRDAIDRPQPNRLWVGMAMVCLLAFLAIRINGGYGNAYPYTSFANRDFWFFAKYPPDLPFLAWAFAIIFASLAALRTITRRSTPTLLRPFDVFGRVPLFFYLVHFYVLGVAAALLGGKLSLLGTYTFWLLLLVLMTWPCIWYYRKKRERPNFITRYL